ncbi:MAG: TonB-dependent siderophore receptor [Aquisalimonadaceae bacterium]
MILRKNALAVSAAVILSTPPSIGAASDQDEDAYTLPALQVISGAVTEGTDAYTTASSNAATKLDMSLRETPQSISVITRTLLDDFGLTNANDALETTPGITVERVETDRTYYTARGFDITRFQFDGIGAPLVYGVVDGDLDTAVYDRIEVVRGANGLMTGTGDPSATVNFVRKRPTEDLQASIDLTAGTWNKRRVDADVSGSLTDSVRGRLVFAHQDRESYLDRYEHEKTVFYGVLEADITADTVLTLGHTQQENKADSPLWGALPLYYADGTPTDYDVSASTSADWAYWEGRHRTSFVELAHWFDNGWRAKAIVSRKDFTENSKLFYVYGTPDRGTPGSDLYAYPSRYDSDNRQLLVDLYATGPFGLFGRTHELMIGAGRARSEVTDVSNYGEGIGTEMSEDQVWDGSYPEPEFTAGREGSEWTDTQASIYSAARFSVTDRLTSILGARVSRIDSEGESYGESKTTSYDAVSTPYAGVVYDVAANHSVYASYTTVFQPQTALDRDRNRLDSVDGVNYEAGLKSELFGRRLNTGIALFRTEQNNVAEPGGVDADTGQQYYRAVDGISSEGVELDIAGQVMPGVQLAAGYTYLTVEDKDGSRTKTYIPGHLVRVTASYRPVSLPRLKVGAGINWQDATYVQHAAGHRTEQDSYALVRLMARYAFSDNLSAALKINNLTDEKYRASMYWASSGQGYYGAPRNANLTLSWQY